VTATIRNPLTIVWALLTAATLAAWLISRDSDVSQRIDAAVTVSVLLVAALKSQLVIRYFMEVRHAPRWLQRTMSAWLLVLFALLIGLYFAGL